MSINNLGIGGAFIQRRIRWLERLEITLKGRLVADLPWRLHGGDVAQYISTGKARSSSSCRRRSSSRWRIRRSCFRSCHRPSRGKRFYTRPQGTGHYEGRYTLDLHVERDFEVDGATWTIAADGFNVLNSGEVTLANTALNTNSDPNALTRYGTALEHQAPRQLRLGAGVRW